MNVRKIVLLTLGFIMSTSFLAAQVYVRSSNCRGNGISRWESRSLRYDQKRIKNYERSVLRDGVITRREYGNLKRLQRVHLQNRRYAILN